jgi:hypothetical protein
MTYQEAIWKGKYVWITGILSKSGRLHRTYRKYVGRGGMVLGEAKNGMLLIQFKGHTRAIPAGCVTEYGTVKSVKTRGKIGTN